MARSFVSKLAGALLAAGLSLAGSAHAALFSNMYVFGDSLSDVGNDLAITGGLVPDPAYYSNGAVTGRFVNGYNYADRLASQLGLSLAPSVLGGNDYAYGGARSTYARPDLAALGALSFQQQVNQYLGNVGGVVDPNALYVLWIGANDMSDGFAQTLAKLAGTGVLDTSFIGNAAANALTTLFTEYATLQALGARHFVIGNVPDLGLTPAVRDLAALFGNPAIMSIGTAASQAFNNGLMANLFAYTAPGTSTTVFDSYGLLHDMTANPAAYGLTNVTSGCYDGQPDGTPSPGASTVSECANPDGYIYFDSEHPSARAHQIGGDLLYVQVVPEPAAMALSVTALGLMGLMRRRRV
ncbi:MAG TPA: SGNH/GDSL hydrolase family protein [Zoogloea sp.]|uniref:SGNH/GDSL hydrolase family protein n=1 Tax=Zoogloea sp. TaxID=49181 RepID=UPI002B775E7A|nr:SGNH/GDSL hydrolase family protein [Zoogloea sp.]HNI47949.1 SGNH/GDSL hydrolase family protein [Zoogloea sp.]